jgi:Fe-S cluster assembly ATP-binding protein
MLELKNLKVTVDEKPIINGVSLNVAPGEVVVVMGPNGSGKSTLAYTLAGHPKYHAEGKIKLDSKDIYKMTPDERAREGLYLANQYPVAIPGLTANSFLWQIYKKRNPEGRSKTNVIQFRKWLEPQAKSLGLKPELLKRGLNDGFSGGEKKKLEILQMLVFNPKYVILDEIDSGLDVDAVKTIAETVVKVVKDRKIGVMIITHYNRILKYLKPDRVVVLEKGIIVREGGAKLATEIESTGYKDADSAVAGKHDKEEILIPPLRDRMTKND